MRIFDISLRERHRQHLPRPAALEYGTLSSWEGNRYETPDELRNKVADSPAATAGCVSSFDPLSHTGPDAFPTSQFPYIAIGT
jgi:hypothetical protein